MGPFDMTIFFRSDGVAAKPSTGLVLSPDASVRAFATDRRLQGSVSAYC